MAESSIPVDLLNPGQIFACLGLLELADKFLGHAHGAFDWSDDANIRFHVRALGDQCPVKSAIDFLQRATVASRSPSRDALSTVGWNVPTTQIDTGKDPFPFPVPDSPATLPVTLSCGDHHIEMSHWGDDIPSSGRDNIKFCLFHIGYHMSD